MSHWPDVSVVIVTWGSARWIGPCLDALAQTRYAGGLETIVVDNASADDSAALAESHPIVRGGQGRVIRNATNRGFGGANNDGWRACAGAIVVFLNADTRARPDWLTPLVEVFLAAPDVAIAGAKLLYPDERTIQHAGGMIYPNAMADHIGAGQEDRGQYDEARDVDYVTGAALAVRRSFLDEVGGFDERFFPAYYEETDLCAQARARGWRVRYEPRSVVIHHESASVKRASPQFLRLFTRGRMRFAAKHFSAADWLLRFLPFELRWLRSWPARGVRRAVVRSYFQRR